MGILLSKRNLKKGRISLYLDCIVNQKWIAKNPLILYIEHRGTEK